MHQISPTHNRLAGAAGLLGVLLVVLCLIGVYLKWFASSVDVTVMSDRTGLLLDRGAPVRVSGVPVGEVRGSKVTSDHRVAITVAIDKGKAHLVPADVVASIRSTTVFGAKFVELEMPTSDRDQAAIRPGQVIQARSVPVEVNDTFHHAMDVLQSIDVEQLNTTLTEIASALNGRGERLGAYLTQVNDYLKTFNATLPTAVTDVQRAKDVLKVYADVTPQFIDVADQAGTTSNTLDANAATLHALLVDMVEASGTAKTFFSNVEDPLVGSLKELTPVTDLLRVYSPEIGCLIDNLNKLNTSIKTSLGAKVPGVLGAAGFLPGQDSYNRSNLPKLVTGVGPVCYPFPDRAHPLYPHVRFDDGTASVYDGIGPVADPGRAAGPSNSKVTTPTKGDLVAWYGMLRYLLGDQWMKDYVAQAGAK